MNKYAYLKRQYPPILTLDEMRTILHISKRKASYMLKNGYIPCNDSGRKTRNFQIKLKDVIFYLGDVEKNPEKYTFPGGAFSTAAPHQRVEWISELPAEDFRLWLEDEWYDAPDAMTIREMARLTGYAASTFQGWISADKLQLVQLHDKAVTPKVWLIDYYCHDGYTITRKSKKHLKLLNRFFEEYSGGTAQD